MEKRMAIDQSGSLGSFYDAYRDIVKRKMFDTSPPNTESVNEPLRFISCKVGGQESDNILKWMGFAEQQRINLLLYPNSQQNIAEFLHKPPSSDTTTHFLYIHHVSSTESCVTDGMSQEKLEEISNSLSATHLITEVSWGISALIFLRVSSDGDGDRLIKALQDRINSETSDGESCILSKIQLIAVYSNIQDLTSSTDLADLCKQIDRVHRNRLEHQRVEYGLTPLDGLCASEVNRQGQVYYPLSSGIIDQLETFLLERWADMNSLRQILHKLIQCPRRRLISLSEGVENMRSQLLQRHEGQLAKLQEAVTNLRRISGSMQSIEELLSDESFKRETDKLHEDFAEVEKKLKFIDGLEQEGIEYVDVSSLGIKQGYTSSLVNDILLRQGQHKAIFCANDEFRQTNEKEWKSHYSKLVAMKKNDSQSKVLYADFSYSTYQLDHMVILPVKQQDDEAKKNGVAQTKKRDETKKDDGQPTINILLLGQSGVGKSTFINAFVNYLRFSSLEEAEKEEPTVVIPVSFILTEGFDHKQRVINFGEPDLDENHNNNGQSVTEHCKSYNLRLPNGRKLCIIDTPGFGDTRGIEQDQINLTRIFNYISHLSYLNGICLLFKSNESELHQCFPLYFNQLIDYFGSDTKTSFIFCYTNSRSTFFSPGNAQKLLGDFFKKQSIEIKFQNKVNTFCFDSESFRFLVAKRNSVEFNDDDRMEFGQSWSKSTEEANRLFNNLATRDGIHFQRDRPTHGQIRLKIELYRRPVLEALRTIIYNIIMHGGDRSIAIHATHSENPNATLSAKYRYFQQVGCILLPLTIQSIPFNKYLRDSREPFPYTMDYEYVRSNENLSDLEFQCNMIRDCFAIFIHFLTEKSSRSLVCPLLSDIDQMIEEECNLSKQSSSKELHEAVSKRLTRFKTDCQEKLQPLKTGNGKCLLKTVSSHIEFIDGIPGIHAQIKAINKYQEMIFKKNQRNISDP